VTPDELREEIAVELEQMEVIVGEIASLHRDVSGREPTTREKTAAAAFLAQFYGGVENVLKRIHRFHGVSLPTGDTWHTDLFSRFCFPPHGKLPVLFDDALAAAMAPYRKFRHVVLHGYGFQMDWERMIGGITNLEAVFRRLKTKLAEYMLSL
jgi:hypothetical protein